MKKSKWITGAALLLVLTSGCSAEVVDSDGVDPSEQDDGADEDVSEAGESSEALTTTCADAKRVPASPSVTIETVGNCKVASGTMATALRCLMKKYPGARCNGSRSSYRSQQVQKQLVCELGCYPNRSGGGAACGTLSNHQRGQAVDLNGNYPNNCGLLRKVGGEPWHYSLNGM
jgi:hypothetical protein